MIEEKQSSDVVCIIKDLIRILIQVFSEIFIKVYTYVTAIYVNLYTIS